MKFTKCLKFRTPKRGFTVAINPENLINDFDFDPKFYSKHMMEIVNESPMPSIEKVQQDNDKLLEIIKKEAAFEGNPLDLIEKDLEAIKSVIFDQIIDTKHEVLKEAAEYNLKLKGKNFRSCVIMLLSRALYSNHPESKFKKFEDTVYYQNSAILSACIEICHNATLLQDDILDNAETRRSK